MATHIINGVKIHTSHGLAGVFAMTRKEIIENSLCLIDFGLCTFALFAWGM